jgi:hypothetical protein
MSPFQQIATRADDDRANRGSLGCVAMERVLTVEFGPSRSKRFRTAVEEARASAGECSELGRGRYRVRFTLSKEAAVFTSLARLLQRVRDWRATEVYEGDHLVSSYHAREMGWCASSQLGWFGECRFRFFYGVLPRCSLCPLFDVERAVRDVLGENTPNMIESRLPPRIEALLAGEQPPPIIAPPLDPNWQIPDHPPDEWWQDLGDAEPSD